MSYHETKDGLHDYVNRKQEKQITGDARCSALDVSYAVLSALKFLSKFGSEASKNDYSRRELNRAGDSESNQQQASRSYSSTDCKAGSDYPRNERADFQ